MKFVQVKKEDITFQDGSFTDDIFVCRYCSTAHLIMCCNSNRFHIDDHLQTCITLQKCTSLFDYNSVGLRFLFIANDDTVCIDVNHRMDADRRYINNKTKLYDIFSMFSRIVELSTICCCIFCITVEHNCNCKLCDDIGNSN
jgi:hypothetical protein